MPRVFISHSSKDKPAVELLAAALAERGIEPWLDKWEMNTGDDLIARINSGLDQAAAGLVVFSEHTDESFWVRAEVSYLIYAKIAEQKPLIPVSIDENAKVPPLLRPYLRRDILEVDAIADAILNRKQAAKPSVKSANWGRVEQVLIALTRQDNRIHTSVTIGGHLQATATHDAIPNAITAALETFRHGFRHSALRSPAEAEHKSAESQLKTLGHALADFCLPGDSAAALASLVDGCPVGTNVEVAIEASGADLLALPFEAIRLPNGQLLSTRPAVSMLRRPAGIALHHATSLILPGPLKILVAVAAPDEGKSKGSVLDQERELQNIMDAVDLARRHDNVEVRVLEVGHPNVIRDALKADAYHVLHISCHGLPGTLEMETEDGEAIRVTAGQLLEPLRAAGRPLPMIFLSSCHGGAQHQTTTVSFAEELLRGGIPSVLAMQTSVTDAYAIDLAAEFYKNLANREVLLPSQALADARKAVEKAHEASKNQPPPEYATASLFIGGAVERPIADFAATPQPLQQRPVYQMTGQVPQLNLGDLIGRRRELRETLRTLRGQAGLQAGVVLTGIGGVGKSAIAGRAMQRLSEDGWSIASHVGRFDVARIAVALGTELLLSSSTQAQRLGHLLTNPQVEDQVHLQIIAKSLAEEKVLIVLDDFEQNLTPGGLAFHNPDIAEYLAGLADQARTGKLLITCRYPIPGIGEASIRRVPIGPLTHAQVRKLLLRLPGLYALDAKETANVLRIIGGHPRMLEFLDALLRGGKGRLPAVTKKLQELATKSGLNLKIAAPTEAIELAITLGSRDILLKELLEIVRAQASASPRSLPVLASLRVFASSTLARPPAPRVSVGIPAPASADPSPHPNATEEILLQAAVSNLPIPANGIAHMLADGSAHSSLTPAQIEDSLNALEDLSFIFRDRDPGSRSIWVHRWTAEGLASLIDPGEQQKRANRAGRYRMWRVKNESHSLEDAIEAVRNHLTGQDYDSATGITKACIQALQTARQSLGIATLASEVLERLPQDDGDYGFIADEEAKAYLALGFIGKAFDRYTSVLQYHQKRAASEPDRADYQRDLSVSYNNVGDLYRDLGQGEPARLAFLKSLAIFEKLADAEPDRADYQRDLSVSYERMGDLYRALGQGEPARLAFLKSLAIREKLVEAEPDRADYQRDLSVSYNRLGSFYRASGQLDAARQFDLKDLAIAEKLASAEPDRADYQVDLAISLLRTAAAGEPNPAPHLRRAHEILERLRTSGRLSPQHEPLAAQVREALA